MVRYLKDIGNGSIQNKVICYGHFSYLHAGHVRYFNFASRYEKSLCVVITSGPGDKSGAAFSIDDRIRLLKKISDIDEFIICDDDSLSSLICRLDNCDLILGKSSLLHADITELELIRLLEVVNSRLLLLEGDEGKFVETLTFPTEEVASKHAEEFKFRCDANSINLQEIANILRKKALLNVLVIGDLIVDDYVATEPLGISAEAPVIVVREVDSRKYVGGAGVVAKHLSAFGSNVTILAVVGKDSEAEYVAQNLSESGVTPSLVVDFSRPTVYKRRYISGYTKLLRVSRISKSSLSSNVEDKIVERLDTLVQSCDAVVVSDFQYGVLNKKTILHLERLAKIYHKPIFVDVQCSSQMGKIDKLSSCYAVFPTEKEARITIVDSQIDIEHLGQHILELCDCLYCILKLGEEGLILFERKSQKRFQLPALSVNAIDVAGAGDSLLASVVYGFANKLSMKECVALGSVVASLNVENLGNEPVSIDKVINRLESISKLF